MEQNHNNETPVELSNQTDPYHDHKQEEFKSSEPSLPENHQESHLENDTPLIEEVNSSLSPEHKSSEINNETYGRDSVEIQEESYKIPESEPENQPLIANELKFEEHSSPKLDEVKMEPEPVVEMKLEEPVEVTHTIESSHPEPQVHEQLNEEVYPLPSEQKVNEQSIETIEQHPIEHNESKHDEEVKDNCDYKYDEDQPLIVDETHLGIPSEREDHDLPINADRIFETNLRERLDDENEVVQGEEGQQEPNERDQALDNEFYQHSLQYLVQNLNNLRDTLQTILTNSELTQEMQGNNLNRNNQLMQNEGMNANNDDHLHDQLMNIRRLLAGNLDNNNAQNNAFGWENELQNRLNLNAQQDVNNEPNRLEAWGQRIETYARQAYAALPKDLNTLSWLIFILTAIFLAYGYTTIPEIPRENPGYFVDWLASHRDARLFILAVTLFYLCGVFKFNQVLHTYFVSDAGEDYYKSFFTLMSKYSPFYDLSLYVFIGPIVGENKLEYFVVTSLLVWYTVSTKLVGLQHQKLNQAAASIHNNADQTLGKMKRIQWVSAIYLIINCQVSYTIIWLAFYSSYLTIFVLSALSLLAVTEPLKVFLSSTILVKNYSLVSNNNTRELSDPKFKIELLIDLINQFTNLLLIIVLSLSYAQQVPGLVIGYYLSFTTAIEKLKNSYNKYSNWLKLQKRLDEIFPIVERSEDAPEELCSICHENLLIARKLPCGHIFHLKCLIYWLENQKTCPNCRATIANLNEIMGNNRPEGTLSRIFNQITAPFRGLFNRA